ncbi:MAG: hypothetical protein EBE86_001755 [Hormoscilla sp. GUM202]|nr:hypothetical protein [Hormoscilla sp. GUM202]
MSQFEYPTLSIAIARMMATAESFNIESAHFAIWVLKAPYSAGHVHHDCIWPEQLSRTWQVWQEMFQMQRLPPAARATSACGRNGINPRGDFIIRGWDIKL